MEPTEAQIDAAYQKYLKFKDWDLDNRHPNASSYYCFKLAFLAGIEFNKMNP